MVHRYAVPLEVLPNHDQSCVSGAFVCGRSCSSDALPRLAEEGDGGVRGTRCGQRIGIDNNHMPDPVTKVVATPELDRERPVESNLSKGKSIDDILQWARQI